VSGSTSAGQALKGEPKLLLQAAALVLLIMAAYLPASRGGFVWDDDAYVTDNPLLASPDGLWRIWFSSEHPSQYFPLAYTTLRFGYGLWGLDPSGYHVLNIILHCANTLLVWVLLRNLVFPAAWLGAALFALHPVQVETVAWVSELKNLQSTFFYLLSLLMWMRFTQNFDFQPLDGHGGREPSGRSRLAKAGTPYLPWRPYALALVFYCLALLSKTTACTLPAALILVNWFQGRPIRRRTLVAVVPFLVLGLGMGLLSLWWERRMGHYGAEYGLAFSLPERLLIAGRAIWFYAAKLIWPATLTFSYPRWHIDSRDALQYGWLAAAVLAGIALWLGRKRIGRGPVAAFAFFVAALSPMLGFIQNFTFRYSFVADHYQYLACVGPLALFAAILCGTGRAGVSPAYSRVDNSPNTPARRRRSQMGGAPWVVGGVLLLLLGTLTWRQCGAYNNLETLMRDTIAKNPESWMAHANLGLCYLSRGQAKEAIASFDRAIELNPTCFEAIRNRGLALSAEGRFDEALDQYKKVLQIHPDDFGAYNNMGLALAGQGKWEEAVSQYEKAIQLSPGFLKAHVNMAIALQRLGRSQEAATHYRTALNLDPQCPEALNNLAWILATHPDAALRNGPEALRLAKEALRTASEQDPICFATLAAAYAENGRFADAVTSARQAEEMATAAGSKKLAQKYHELGELFSAGLPFRDAPVIGAEGK
jgi:tetratricopeptide (TPR) repeat protein